MMKYWLFLLLMAGYIFTASAQEQLIQASLTDVTVFLQGAQLTMKADAQIPSGKSVFKISKLPPTLDQNSIQVKGEGAFTIQSVAFQINYLDSLENSREREVLNTRLAELIKKREEEGKLQEILSAKNSFLVNNQVLSGKDQAVSAEQYRLMWEMYSKNIESVLMDMLNNQRRINEITKEMTKINNQLSQRSRTSGKSAGEVLISVYAKNPVSAKFEVNYYLPNAAWYPFYDIRVDKLEDPLNLVYKAKVYQMSGFDWKNIHLTLSNASPRQSGVIPELYPNYLNFLPRYTYKNKRYSQEPSIAYDKAPQPQTEGIVVQDYKAPLLKKAETPEVDISVKQSNVEFSIEGTYTINSDGKTQNIDIQKIELPAEYLYKGIPKLDKEGYLIARIKNWEQYNLLEGEANLYFENTFVGKSVIGVSNISDTLVLSLGQDKGVVLSRTKVKDFSQKQFIGNSNIETRVWEIGIKNNKNQKIRLAITDQVPVSQNNDIQVDVDEISGGSLDKTTGMVQWELELNPKETKKLTLKYVVKYPKSQILKID